MAIEHLETALDMAPAWIQVRSMLAIILQRNGKPQRSQTLLKQCEIQMENASALAGRL